MKKTAITFLLVIILLPSVCFSAIKGALISGVYNNFSIYLAGYGLNYKETIGGSFYNSEKGMITGNIIELSKSLGNVVATLGGDYYSGSLKYEGFTFAGQPVSFDSDHKVYDGYLKLLYLWQPTDNFTIQAPIVKSGYHHWDRPVDKETYQHWFGAGGVGLGYLIKNRVYLSADFLIGSTFGAKMQSDMDFKWAPPGQEFNLTGKLYTEEKIQATIWLAKKFFVSTFVGFTQYKYGASNINEWRMYEPDSRTFSTSLGVGLIYAL